MEERIKKMLAEGRDDDAVVALEEYVQEQPEEEALLCLGELYYKKGDTRNALNKFNAVLRINPDNKKASTYVRMINDVLDYFHKDNVNP